MVSFSLEPSDLARRLRYVGYDDSDRERIASISSLVDANAESLAQTFFALLAQVPEADRLTKDARRLGEARALKVEHLRAMTRGRYDASYARERNRLAKIYADAGIDAHVFLGAFHQLMTALAEQVVAAFPAEGFRRFLSLKKIAFFDIGLMVDVLIEERERVIAQQREALIELSTPVLEIAERVLLLPLIGNIDGARARQLSDHLLNAVHAARAKLVVIDVTGVPTMDTSVANGLVQATGAARLMGARAIVAGISGPSAQALTALGVDVESFEIAGDLRSALATYVR
jgi:rsbT co-antagonist protein RsbR